MSLDLTNATDVPQIGLNLTADPVAFKPGEYSYMLNGCLYDTKGKAPFARMYKGTVPIAILPAGYYPIGSANIAQREVCLFLVNPSTGESEIGLFNGRFYQKVANHSGLGFKINKQIQAVVDEDFNGSKTVIWVQADAPVRSMDLNKPPILNGELDIDALNVFKKYTYPNLAITDITSNGRLLAGAYYIALQYADENGNGLTSCTTPIGPINIYRDGVSQPVAFMNGSPDREPTDKAIKLALSNLDKSFKYVNIVVIKSYQGIRSSVIASTIPTYQTSYLYTGLVDTERDITLDQVLTPGVSYFSAKTIALSNGVTLLGNLKGKKEFNFQPFISRVGVQWQLVKEIYDNSEASYANPLKSLYELQFRRNEVYDLGLVIRWADGAKSRVYPLIARKKNMNSAGLPITIDRDTYGNPITQGWDSSPTIVNDDLFESGSVIPERWQTGNTAYVVGDDLVAPATEGAHLFGEFSYWEATERYPNDRRVWGDDAGQPIRRFRMPNHNVAPIMDGRNDFRTETATPAIFKLGIRFTNIEDIMNSLPDDIKKEISGWELVRADRRNNKSVIGSGVIFNMFYTNWRQEGGLEPILGDVLFPGQSANPDDVRLYANYPLNDLRPDYLYRKKFITGNDDNENLSTGNDRYRKDVFTFLSPDTSFQQNLLFSGEMLLHSELYGPAKNRVFYIYPYPELQDKGNEDLRSVYQNLTTAYYYNWKAATQGNLRRQIKEAMYIPFGAQVSSGAVGLPVQNLTRESTVLLYTGKPVANPTVEDTSRSHLTDPDFGCNFDANTRNRVASIHYVSIISRIANQYGSIFDPRYCFTNFDNTNIRNNKPVFGGDSYIGPYSIKRQLMLYQNGQAFKDLPDGEMGIDLKNSDTISGTRYYYEAFRKKARKDSFTECEDGNAISKMPLIYTGLPVIFCESDYNIALRINGANQWETFYPNLKDGSIRVEDWTGINNIDKDNDYALNPSYNESNDLFGYQGPDPFYDPETNAETNFSTRVIFSLPGKPENRFNNLLVFLPLNYHDFPRDSGDLTDIRDVGAYQVLFRLQHAFYINRLYAGIASDEGTINLGSGKLFETAPQRLSKSDSGYSGSSEQWAFNNTPFGAFCTDAKRGAAFVFGKTLNDITANDVDSFAAENMPFKLLEDIPGFVDIDNPANPEAIGFHSIYDSKGKMWLITKRDYELIDKTKKGLFTVIDGQLRYNNGPVSLNDKTLFHDRSWTFSFDPKRQKWIGWLSFTPTFYFELNNEYYSFADGQIWCHNNPIPRFYYGKRYPFIVETVLKSQGTYIYYTSSFVTRAFPIANGVLQGESFEETFNKAHIFNLHQSTGEMVLTVMDENDLSTIIRNPVITATSQERFLGRLNQTWNIDQLYDMVADHNKPFLFPGWQGDIDHSNIDYTRDYKEAAVLRDLWSKHRLIYDKETDIQLHLYMAQALTEISVK